MVDTCGTGGDGSRSINVSTIAAFVVAGAGVTVPKHGNRAQSSQSGAHDVIEALGLNPSSPPELSVRCLQEAKLAFLFAPAHHAATKHAVGPRKELGVPDDLQPAGAADEPVRRARARQRHLRARSLRAAGEGARRAGLAARAGHPRRGRAGRVRARRGDVRRRAGRRRGQDLRGPARRLRPVGERSGGPGGRHARRQRAHRAGGAGRQGAGGGAQRGGDDRRGGAVRQRRRGQPEGGRRPRDRGAGGRRRRWACSRRCAGSRPRPTPPS